jgi:hypothetical protein
MLGCPDNSGHPSPLPPMTRSPRPGPHAGARCEAPCAVRRAGGGTWAEAGAYGPFPASL